MKITIFTNNLEIGGIENALRQFIKRLQKEEDMQITLYVLRKEGSLLKEFESFIDVCEIPKLSLMFADHFKQDFKLYFFHFKYLRLLKLIFWKIKRILFKNSEEVIINSLRYNINAGDIAIVYQVPVHPLTIFVANKVQSSRKILWNHAELDSVNRNLIKHYYSFIKQYDGIFSVSDVSNDNVKRILPELSDKCYVYHNYIDTEEIIRLSYEKKEYVFDNKIINIVTVGRLSYDKGYDILIESAKKLKNKGLNFKWFIIGEGEERRYIENLIQNERLSKEVVLIGRLSNPYPYMKDCDIYVQTSRFEGYGLTTTEAMILKKIVISTNTSGISEKIKNGINGIVCECTSDSISNKILEIVNNKELMKRITNNLNEPIYLFDDIDLLYKKY